MNEPTARLKIGEAARAAGVHVQTLRYYERRGLLRPPARRGRNYRAYDRAAVERVRAIKRAQRLGFTLDEVEQLSQIRDGGLEAERLLPLVAEKLAEIDDKLRDLRRMKRSLSQLVEACACGGAIERCDVLDGLGAERR